MIEIFYLDKTLSKVKPEEFVMKPNSKVWIDITGTTKADAEWVGKLFDLHPLTVEDIQNANTRVKIEEFNSYLLCVFYGISKGDGYALDEVDYIMSKNFLVTAHAKESYPINDLKDNLAKTSDLLSKGTDFLFHRLLDGEVDNYFPVISAIDDDIEKIEDKITENPKPAIMNEILDIKRNLNGIRKVVLPQREKIGELAKKEHALVSSKIRPYFRDVYDHSIKVMDDVNASRELISNAFEFYMSAVSNNMNSVMKVFSMIATIALPITALSGIYGTNFQNLPGAAQYFGFWAMIAVMVGISVTMLLMFRRKGWI